MDLPCLALTDKPPEELQDLFQEKKMAVTSGINNSIPRPTQSTIRTMFRKLTVISK